MFNDKHAREQARAFVNNYRIVQPYWSYMEPRQDDISEAMKKMASFLKKKIKYSPSTLRDLANYFSHPERPELEAPDLEKANMSEDTKEKLTRYYEERSKMFELLGEREWSGDTFLQKAVHAYTVYMEEKEKQDQAKGKGQGQGGEGDPGNGDGEGDDFDTFAPGAGSLAGELTNKLKKVYKHLDVIDKIKANPTPLLETIGMGAPFPEELVLSEKQNYEMKCLLDAFGKLEMMSDLKVDEVIDKYEDPDGDDSNIRELDNLGEMMMLDAQDFADPEFMQRILELDFDVTVQVRPEKAKQVLIVLIDRSGSMQSTDKQAWVKAILFNRMTAVIKGHAKLYVASFEVNRDTVYKIETEEDCVRYLKNYRCQGGGGTDIQAVLARTCDDIKKLKIDNFPLEAIEGKSNIVIVNDGQDHVNKEYVPNITTHALILGCDNHDLKTVCETSGGTYNRFL